MLLFVLLGSLAGLCSAVIGLGGGLTFKDAFTLYLSVSLVLICVAPMLCHFAWRLNSVR